MNLDFYKNTENKKLLEIMLEACIETASLQKSKFQGDLIVKTKANFRDLVTEADIASQELIQKIITEGCLSRGYRESEIGFFGEEDEARQIKDLTFVIDPIDGTANFAYGIPIFSISIGLYIRRELVAGIIYDTTRDECYLSLKNSGSYKITPNTEKKLEIKPKELSASILGGNFSSIKLLSNNFIEKLFGVRVFYGFALDACLVSQNSLQILLAANPKLWDIAAAYLIVTEAGGSFYDYDFNDFYPTLDKEVRDLPIVICHQEYNQKIKSEIVKCLQS